jgi:hypothetical protein
MQQFLLLLAASFMIHEATQGLSLPQLWLPQTPLVEAAGIDLDQQRALETSCSHITVDNTGDIIEKISAQLETSFDGETAEYIKAALRVSQEYCKLEVPSKPSITLPSSGKQVFQDLGMLFSCFIPSHNMPSDFGSLKADKECSFKCHSVRGSVVTFRHHRVFSDEKTE